MATADGEGRPRSRGRAKQSSDTRAQILHAAAAVFSEKGYAGASLNDITALSGVTKGALYWHFSSKEDLALEIVRATHQRWPLLVAGVVDGQDDAVQALVDLSHRAAERLARDTTAQAAQRLVVELPPQAARQVPMPYRMWEASVEAVIVRGQAARQIDPGIDARSAAQTLIACVLGMHQVSLAVSGRQDLQSRLDAFWELLRPRLGAAQNRTV